MEFSVDFVNLCSDGEFSVAADVQENLIPDKPGQTAVGVLYMCGSGGENCRPSSCVVNHLLQTPGQLFVNCKLVVSVHETKNKFVPTVNQYLWFYFKSECSDVCVERHKCAKLNNYNNHSINQYHLSAQFCSNS